MYIFIGVVIAAAGIAYAVYQTKKMNGLNLEIQSIQTSQIADAKDIVDSLSQTDPNYRHYVELKGNAFTKEKVIAPFTGREVAYYQDTTYAVTEEEERYRDNDGHEHVRHHKNEEELSHEESSVTVYVKDSSCPEGICIDMDTFSGCMDLQPGCDRMEQKNSDWVRSHNNYFMGFRLPGGRFLGYRLKESILTFNQPVYILGEMYKLGDEYHVGYARLGKKASKFSFKSEDELVANNESAKKISWLIAVIAVVIGIFIACFVR